MGKDENVTTVCFQEIRAAISPIVAGSIAELDPVLADVARYHFGVAAPDSHKLVQGKALRPALVTLGRPLSSLPAQIRDDVVIASAAVEMVHQWSLMEDDIIDDDHVRRGRPSTWAMYGVSRTLLTADAIQAQAVRMIVRLKDCHASHLEGVLETISKLVTGQALELAFSQSGSGINVTDYSNVATSKTGALLAFSLALGMRIQGGDESSVNAATRIGHHLGLSWQASNDLEDIWSDSADTGKPSSSDSRQGKLTLPRILAATEMAGAASRGEADPPTFEQLLTRSQSIEIRDRTVEFSDRELDRAFAASHEIDFVGYRQKDLAELLRLIVHQSQSKYLPNRLPR